MENLPGEAADSAEAQRLQAEYLERLGRLLGSTPPEIRQDVLREVQSHIEDEWQAVGGGLDGLRGVLQRLGSPEEYGRDLALQSMLQPGPRRTPGRLALAGIFWASTSLIGALVVIGAALVFAFAAGMLITAVYRAFGAPVTLIDGAQFIFFDLPTEQFRFPPESWPPALIAAAGFLPAAVVGVGLYRFLAGWMRSRLAQRGLALVGAPESAALLPGGERRALLAMLAFAGAGLAGCVLFSSLSEWIFIRGSGMIALPEELFRTPLTLLAFLSGLVFLVSPMLGLFWAARRASSEAQPGPG